MSNIFAEPWGRTIDPQGIKLLSDRTIVQSDLATVLARSPVGDPGTAISQSMWGLNHRSLNNSIPINKDYYGLTLFTKPDMRLDDANLRRDPRLAAMMNPDGNSQARALRAMMDSRGGREGNGYYPSKFIDEKQAFMPILTNQLVSMSGWQDVDLPVHTSEAGLYGEMYSFADGVAEVYRTYDISANFRNIPGDPITYLFYYWILYAAGVYSGDLVPYPANVRANRIDYQTRIYRLVLDHTKRYVQKIAYCGAAFPTGVQLGQHFNFEADTPINRGNDQITISFRAIGAEYLSDRCVAAFNKVVTMANNDMLPNNRKSAGLVKIPYEYIYLFNFVGYPWINYRTYELEWWISEDEYRIATGSSRYDTNEIEGVDAGELGYTPGFNMPK